jgi:hypothetical protein
LTVAEGAVFSSVAFDGADGGTRTCSNFGLQIRHLASTELQIFSKQLLVSVRKVEMQPRKRQTFQFAASIFVTLPAKLCRARRLETLELNKIRNSAQFNGRLWHQGNGNERKCH